MAVPGLEPSGKSARSCDRHNHWFARSTRVSYAVIIVKAGKVGIVKAEKVGAQIEGPRKNPDETLSRTCR